MQQHDGKGTKSDDEGGRIGAPDDIVSFGRPLHSTDGDERTSGTPRVAESDISRRLWRCTFFFVGLILVAAAGLYNAPNHQPANKETIPQQTTPGNEQTSSLDTYLEKNVMFQTIQRVDHDAYERFRQIVRDGINSGATSREMEAKAAQFGDEFMQSRLRYASPATLKQYLRLRTEMLERMFATSPEATYDILASAKIDMGRVPESVRLSFRQDQKRFLNEMANIIAAPISDTPLPQNEAMVQRRLGTIRAQLTDAEHEAFRNENKPTVNRAVYCKATIHLYREVLKLPENEAVQVSRFLGLLPKDDRNHRQPEMH